MSKPWVHLEPSGHRPQLDRVIRETVTNILPTEFQIATSPESSASAGVGREAGPSPII